jgi:chromate transporter
MRSQSSPADGQNTTAPPAPTLRQLFLAFAGISVVGFGGVMPWAHRMLVEKRRWMTVTEFAEALALAQFLPGGNILNLSVAVGQRFQGALGAIAAVTGLVAPPAVVVMVLGALYARYGHVPELQDALAGVAAGAAGLILAMVVKLAQPLWQRRDFVSLGIVVAGFVCVVILKAPLLAVLAILSPISIAYYWWRMP